MIHITKSHYIKSLGIFLYKYQSDLNYIQEFQKFKIGNISTEEYLTKEKGMFQSFINEFRVARNIPATKRKGFLYSLKEELKEDNIHVDSLAQNMKNQGLTYGKSVSLCSKILFLNNPYEIIPIDTLARKTLDCKDNNYKDFKVRLEDFRIKNQVEMSKYLDSVKCFTEEIEREYSSTIDQLDVIKNNRFLDYILWTQN